METMMDLSMSEFFTKVMVAAQGGDGLIMLGLALMAIIWVTRKYAVKYVSWFGTDFGGMVFAFLMSSMTVAASALAGGMGMSMTVLSSAATAGLVAVGGWSGVLKKIPWLNK